MSKGKWLEFTRIKPTEKQLEEWPLERIEREWVVPQWVQDIINGVYDKKID